MGKKHTFIQGSKIFAIFVRVHFGTRQREEIAKYCWRFVLEYFLSRGKLLLCWKSEYITDENIWSWQIWKVVTCRWNIKCWKREMEMRDECELFRQMHGHAKHGEQREAENNKSWILIPVGFHFSNLIEAGIWAKILMCRYSGRTQKQMQEHVRENFVKRQSFQRWFLHSSYLCLCPSRKFFQYK